MKYTLEVFILTISKLGETESETVKFEFKDERLIDARNAAISKAKELVNYFNGKSVKEKFDSPAEAKLKGYHGIKGHSIDIYFIPKEDFDYQIYGEDELTIEALEQEAYYYAQESNVEFTEIEDLYGDMVKVLESDLEFFLN